MAKVFETTDFVHVCAPMVRYSKLAFRTLVRGYDVHLAYTPMIIADSFANSAEARNVEFTTLSGVDAPLVVQFAASRPEPFVAAAQLVARDCDGVELNCGCPQKWALKEGIGACLIDKPEMVADLIRQTRNRCGDSLGVSIKIRLHEDWERQTVELGRRLEAAGASYITVHGRTKDQRAEPVNLEAIKCIKQGRGKCSFNKNGLKNYFLKTIPPA
jgi:tRNA-dihydrouridine synthase 4